MSKRILLRAAQSARHLLCLLADKFNGNAARRIALHRQAITLADELRRQRLARELERANRYLGPVPRGHRAMLIWRAHYYRDAV